jgi:hypothetical protein
MYLVYLQNYGSIVFLLMVFYHELPLQQQQTKQESGSVSDLGKPIL